MIFHQILIDNACPVETSIGYKIPIEQLFKLKKLKSKLALDATASIGLEKNHELCDVAALLCRFIWTTASFIVFNRKNNNNIRNLI